MFSFRALLGSFILGALLSLAVTVLSFRFEIASRFEVDVPSFIGTAMGLTACLLAVGLYPVVGATYSYLHPQADRRPTVNAFGGAGAALVVLVWQLLFAALISPTDPIASFRQGLLAAPIPYRDNPILLIAGLLLGFSIVVALVAAMGAAGAMLSRAVLSQRPDHAT